MSTTVEVKGLQLVVRSSDMARPIELTIALSRVSAQFLARSLRVGAGVEPDVKGTVKSFNVRLIEQAKQTSSPVVHVAPVKSTPSPRVVRLSKLDVDVGAMNQRHAAERGWSK